MKPVGWCKCSVLLGSVIYLAGCSSSGKEVLRTPPTWVDRLPEQRGWVFAVGYSPSYLELEDSWEAAEIEARENLSRSLRVKVSRLSRWWNSKQIEITREELDREALALAWLGGVTRAQYYDEANRLFYVLVGMRTDLRIEELVKKTEKIFQRVERGKEISNKEIREMAERAFEALEAFFERRDFQNIF